MILFRCFFFSLFVVEDQNFALFNYVNELNGEIEMILKEIEQVGLHLPCTCTCIIL